MGKFKLLFLYFGSCGFTCGVETGWGCSGGSTTAADTCTETCGDSVDWDTLPCEDGVLNSGG